MASKDTYTSISNRDEHRNGQSLCPPYGGLPAVCARTMAALRVVVGAGSLISPKLACQLAGLSASTDSTMTRLFGSRDLVLAVAYWVAERWYFQPQSSASVNEARRTIAHVLWAGVLIDAIDVGNVGIGIVQGTITSRAVWAVGVAAFSFVCAGAFGLSRC